MSGIVQSVVSSCSQYWPGQLFSGGIGGMWYDPSDLSTLYQDNAGSTPVTAVEQPVGLIKDKSGNGNDASQSSESSRPTLRARYNMLTHSENFSNAVWEVAGSVNVTSNSVNAPNGTLTADTITFDSSTEYTWIGQGGITLEVDASYTFSVWLKRASGTGSIQINVNPYGNGGSWVTVAISDEWQRFEITQTSTATTTPSQTCGILAIETGQAVYAWGAQLMSSADVAATGNQYQSISSATSYTTGGVFRPYLSFDGADDSLYTGTVDFTNTDKISIFSGSTKYTDSSSYNVLVEFSQDSGLNDGAFGVFTPGASGYGGSYTLELRGTTLGGYNIAPYVAPATKVITSLLDIGASSLSSEIVPRVNGTINQTNPYNSAGTGNFGSYALYIGRRNNSTGPLNGRIYSLIIRAASSSSFEVTSVERWINGKTGAY